MLRIGYALSSEEHPPDRLVELARIAEEVGFDFAMLSDHYHPWTSHQGQSGFAWSVLGSIAQVTRRLRIATGVTCPTTRIHPAIIAQAAATTACLFGGRFMLGVGSGENLNEHVLGDRWPEPAARLERLEEAIGVIRGLWKGETFTHRGKHFTVDEARLFTLPESVPPILVAGTGPRAARLAGRSGDGLIALRPDRKLVAEFERAGGARKPRFGQITACYARSESEGRRTAHAAWPNSGLPRGLAWELKTTELFDRAVELVREEDLDSVVCGSDPEIFVSRLREYESAGFDHAWFHQVGPEQEAFLRFAGQELLSSVRSDARRPPRVAARRRR